MNAFGHPTYYMGRGIGLYEGIFALAFWAALVALVVVVAILIVRHSRKNRAHVAGTPGATFTAPVAPSVPAEDSALQIARERLARGEIDPEQYRAIVEALNT